MGFYINCGKYHKNYKYVILTGIFMTSKYYIPHLLIAIFSTKEIINEYTASLFDHEYIMDNFRLFVMMIFSIIFYIYEKKSSKSESNFEKSDNLNSSNSSNSDKGCFGVIKDNDEKKKKLNETKNYSNLNIIIIVIICLITEFFTEIISYLSLFTYWMVILLIISYINTKMFIKLIIINND